MAEKERKQPQGRDPPSPESIQKLLKGLHVVSKDSYQTPLLPQTDIRAAISQKKMKSYLSLLQEESQSDRLLTVVSKRAKANDNPCLWRSNPCAFHYSKLPPNENKISPGKKCVGNIEAHASYTL